MSSRKTHETTEGFEGVNWDHSTFNLPLKDLDHHRSDTEKNRYYSQTVLSLDGATAPSLTKLNVFSSRFAYESLATEVSGSFQRLFDATYGFDAPIRAREVGVFRFSDVVLRQAAGTLITMATGTPITAANRTRARFLTFTLSIAPDVGYDGRVEDRTAAQLQPRQYSLGVALPTTVEAGVTTLHPTLDSTELCTPAVALALIEAVNSAPPMIGYAARATGGFSVEIDFSRFRKDFMEYYHECRFRMLKVIMRREFLGNFAQSAGSIQEDLLKIRQVKFDTKSRSLRTRSVEDFHIEFMRCLDLHPKQDPYGFDPAMLFWTNTAADIRSAALSERYSVPTRPAGETNTQALARLRLVKAEAESYERKIQVVQTQVNRSRGHQSRVQSRNEIFVHPEIMDWNPEMV
jgi:hypothetical protein